MHETRLGTSSLQCLLERVDDEFGAEVVLERPADDATAIAVHDHGEIQPALPGAQVGDVGDPESVRSRRLEVALDEIVGDTHARNPNCRAATAPFQGAADARLPHQPLNPLPTDGDTVGAQVTVDPWRPVGTTAREMELPHPLQQQLVADGARRQRPPQPGVEAGAADAE